MILADTIKDFELFLDDTTELSTAEEIRLAEKHYQRISELVPWEKLKKNATGTVSAQAIAFPTRFNYLVKNNSYTNTNQYAGEGPVIFIGTDYIPYKVVSYSDRKQYRNDKNVAYLDVANDQILFTDSSVNGKAYDFDYIQYPATLTATTDTLWIPDRFAPMLYHAMCADDFVIQQSEKGRSYRDEHISSFNMFLADMKMWNARLVQMD